MLVFDYVGCLQFYVDDITMLQLIIAIITIAG